MRKTSQKLGSSPRSCRRECTYKRQQGAACVAMVESYCVSWQHRLTNACKIGPCNEGGLL